MGKNVNFDADGLFRKNCRKAEEMLENPDKVEKLLQRLEKKLEKLPILEDALTCIPRMAMLLNSWLKKEYNNVPLGSLVAIVGAILYFVLPMDVIADYIPVLGLLDDAGVALIAMNLVDKDINEYMDWRLDMGLDGFEPVKG